MRSVIVAAGVPKTIASQPDMKKLILPWLLLAASTLGACEFVEGGLVPSLTGEPVQTASRQPANVPAQAAAPAGAGLASGRPFVVIRFDNPEVEYEQQLYDAVSTALAQRPQVAFDLVGVAPAAGASEDAAGNGEAARASTDRVMQSLLDMGLPADRVSVSQIADPGIQGNEVRLYVR
jgi:hypothetical protein